jgi:MFS family permease
MGATTRDRTDARKLFAAAGISQLGDGVRTAALPLLAVVLSPTPAAAGIVGFAGTVPILLFTLLGGALADRHDRRAIMWRSDLARGVVVGAFAVWVLTTAPPLWGLAAMTFLLGSVGTLFDNASSSFVADLFGPEPADLAAANGRLQIIQLGTLQFVGPPLGAALFAVSTGAPLVLDAASFVIAALLVLAIRIRHEPARPDRSATLRADIAEGVRWLWRQHGLRLLALELGLANLCLQMGTTMLALLIVHVLGAPAAVYGAELAAGAVGGLLGSLAAGPVRRRLRPGPGLGLSIGLISCGLLLAGVAWSIPVLAVAYALGAFGIMLWNVQAVVIRQRLVPRALMGRVTSAYRLIGWGAGPVGAALGGVLGTALDVRAPVIIGGVVLAASLALVPRLAALETTGTVQ